MTIDEASPYWDSGLMMALDRHQTENGGYKCADAHAIGEYGHLYRQFCSKEWRNDRHAKFYKAVISAFLSGRCKSLDEAYKVCKQEQ